ncbi:hypothetical protein [Streptomyces sp. NPDC051183]|uniref:hypothetical protein n=1 Tax=Streptomyces sp. NPDC051183 TaxID=3155165 RepID=UPI0034414F49
MGTVPVADLTDPARTVLLEPAWMIEIAIGDEDPVDSVILLIRGTGDAPRLRVEGAV